LGNVTYQAFKWNSPIKVTYPGGANSEYQYDPLMRIKKILEYDPAQNPVMTREYAYSQASNVLSKKTEHGDYSYGYDELYRLNREIRPDFADNRQLVTDDYTYDAIGNRLSKTGIPGNWSYNANAELLGFGNTSFQYDPNGNLTNKTDITNGTNRTDYIYDVADQLISVTRFTSDVSPFTASYAYDPFGRRLWKQVDGVRTYFVYSDEGLTAECDQQGSLTKTYGYRPNSQWTTDPLFQKIGDSYYWYKNDAQGTPQKMVDTSGHVVWEARYDAFGNCAVITQEIENNLRLAGQYFDKETGLYYNYHRYYDPVTGRYLQTDPYREGLNLYAYCSNNPNSFIDPMGSCQIWKGIKWFVNAFVQGFFNTANGIVYIICDASNFIPWALGNIGISRSDQEFLMLFFSQPWAIQAVANALGALPVYIDSLLDRGVAGEITEGMGIGKGTATIDELQGAAAEAKGSIGPGDGPVYGTKVHSAFESEVNALGNPNLTTEVSYFNGQVVPRGTPGSIRVDVVEGPLNAPTAIYDLKTGGATLTPQRISQIQQHVPGGNKVPVIEVR
jgi:RHS repeat-associated protein